MSAGKLPSRGDLLKLCPQVNFQVEGIYCGEMAKRRRFIRCGWPRAGDLEK